jgi:hypothetical protein
VTQRASNEVEAANGALELCYQRPIASLASANNRARAMARTFGTARDYVLVRRDWNFASRWDSPASTPTAPSSPHFSKQYPLDPDVLVVREVEGLGEGEWEVSRGTLEDGAGATIEQKVLLCDIANPKVRVTRIVENVGAWDAAFVVLFQKMLASLNPKLHRDPRRAEALRVEVDEELEVAERIDAQEAPPKSMRQDTSWLRARSGGLRR